jgi:signal transduction histidine kinase/ActR/RegA family two-component response regulator
MSDAEGGVRSVDAENAELRRQLGDAQRTIHELRVAAMEAVQWAALLHEVGEFCAVVEHGVEACARCIVEAAIAITRADKGNLQLFDRREDVLAIVAQQGFERPFLDFFHKVRIDERGASCGAAMQTLRRVEVEDVTRSDIFVGTPSLAVILDAGVRACQSTPLLSTSGKVLGMISTHFGAPHTIAAVERHFMELLARQAADYFERIQAEAQLRDVVEQAPFGIYIIDSQFRIAHMNARSQSGAFRNVRPVIGRDFAEAMRILWPEPVAAEIIARFRHTLATGDSYRSPEFVNPRADVDAVESYEWELHRVTLANGQHGVVCYYFDSTRLREAEHSLREADRRKDLFLATLAHELRNPLAPMRTAAAILREPVSDKQARNARDVIDRQVGNMARLIDDLMDASRISRGKVELLRKTVDLTTVLHTALETTAPLLEGAKQTLAVKLPTRTLWLHADAARLAQVFANLLDNASKFSPRGSHIRLDAEEFDGHAMVRVRDEGAGIGSGDLDAIFGMFVQAGHSPRQAHGGLGIGLSLARALVEQHGGSVEAKSDGKGLGAEFVVRLPLVAAPGGTIGPDSGHPVRPARAAQPLRVLVVDDNEDAARMLGTYISTAGHEVSTATDGAKAMEIAATLHPDVALLDLGMPGVDGFELAKRIRREHWRRPVLLVAVTGWGNNEYRQRSSDAGFDHHLVKPVAPEAVHSLLHEAMQSRVAGKASRGSGPS